MKTCFRCKQSKPILNFCVTTANRDSRSHMCRECWRVHRVGRRDAIRAYNRSPERRQKQLEYNRRFMVKHPDRRQAHVAVRCAIKKGLLVRLPCEVCRSFKTQAHHHDYSKPLSVIWLCFKHHRDVEHGRIEISA